MFWHSESMFGFTKNKNKSDKRQKKQDKLQASCVGSDREADRGGDSSGIGQSKKSAKIRAEALANASMARQQIGEDVLDKIAAAMTKKQQSATERAKAQIQKVDPDRVLDELKWLLDESRGKV